jgi:DUF4097 and DUF4098 domain-containing protein YvlB
MNRRSRSATWMGALLGALCALIAAVPSQASTSRAFTEEFHQTYPLSAGGRVDLENVNGAVHITAWDRNEVKVDAVKYAGTKERLDEAQIKVNASADSVSIHTDYRDRDLTFNDYEHDNPAGVEYTLTVPRGARLSDIRLINGSLEVSGVSGEVDAECINGRLTATGLGGRAKLSTINSRLNAQFDHLATAPIELSSVNGRVELTLPSDAKAELSVSTVHGGIENDFGFHVIDHRWVGHDMAGQLGGGGTRIRLNNVNGGVEIHHAQDGKTLSPAHDLNRDRRDDDKDDDDDDI